MKRNGKDRKRKGRGNEEKKERKGKKERVYLWAADTF